MTSNPKLGSQSIVRITHDNGHPRRYQWIISNEYGHELARSTGTYSSTRALWADIDQLRDTLQRMRFPQVPRR